MPKFHKDNLTFKVVATNSAKNTVTLRPTFGTLIKINVAAGALLYVGYLMVNELLDDREEKALQRTLNDTPEKS